MPAARTPGATIPEELQRQADRIQEQLQQLNIILDTVTGHVDEMSSMMQDYSPELVNQLTSLSNHLSSYKSKAANIYGDVSATLSAYSKNLLYNLENLSARVTEIGRIVESL